MSEFPNCKEEGESAWRLQKEVRSSESKKRESGVDYDEIHVRQSIVHTREDLVLLVPLVTHILSQTKKVNTKLSIIVALLIVLITVFLMK